MLLSLLFPTRILQTIGSFRQTELVRYFWMNENYQNHPIMPWTKEIAQCSCPGTRYCAGTTSFWLMLWQHKIRLSSSLTKLSFISHGHDNNTHLVPWSLNFTFKVNVCIASEHLTAQKIDLVTPKLLCYTWNTFHLNISEILTAS